MSLEKLVYDTTSPKLSAYTEAYGLLVRNPTQLSNLINDPVEKEFFKLSFEETAFRITKLFDVGRKVATKPIGGTNTKALASVALTSFLLPLLEDAVDELSTDEGTLTNLIISILNFSLPYADYKGLVKAATMLSEEKRGILEKMVTQEAGANLLRDFAAHENFFKTFKDSSICEAWLRPILRLLSTCPVGHGMEKEVSRWHALCHIKTSLTETRNLLEKQKARTASRIPAQKTMRELQKDDKKSGKSANHVTENLVILPQATLQSLDEVKIDSPHSLLTIETTLARVSFSEFPDLLQTLLKTFPCKRCYESVRKLGKQQILQSESAVTAGVSEDMDEELPAENISPLFGGHIGIWKILLSSQAVGDIKSLSKNGNQQVLRNTFEKLASGAWKGAHLSEVVGSAAQKQYMKSPLLRARCGNTSIRILWQIHVCYQEDSKAYKQAIRVWRVFDLKEIKQGIEQVVLYHRYYTGEQDDKFSTLPLQSSEVYVPREFANEIFYAGPPMASEEPVDRHALELNNKFHALTKPVLQSLFNSNFEAEFPFDLSEEEIKIIKHFSAGTLILGRSGTGKTTCLQYQMLSKYLARKLVPDEEPIKQLLLTRSSQLASKLKKATKILIESRLATTDEHSDAVSADASADDEDITLFEKNLNDIKPDEFPFVCTFDKFMQLLENTVKWANRADFASGKSLQTMHNGRQPQMVDFHIFLSEYWERLGGNGLAPDLVFSEIMGVIKGSATDLADLSVLSRDAYIQRSCRLAPTFKTVEARNLVYSIYEKYEKRKLMWGDKDGIDRVMSLLTILRDNDNIRTLVKDYWDEIYVDEIQDQRCIEIEFLMSLVRDPMGIHFAGDTAQCISKDATFRFQDVKALFYERFLPMATATSNQSLASPKMFYLKKNYRSHQGIIELGSYFMKLLYKWFPDTVDKLDEEIGNSQGPRPIMFVGFDAHTLAAATVGLVNINDTSAATDFGSEQVILVRDDVVKQLVQKELGDSALILTILDSKGMEFDDVLLFDFFSSTPNPGILRYIERPLRYEYMGKDFDPVKNAGLCSELKQLYVAITRARDHLWIVESSTSTVVPITNVLTNFTPKPLVDVVEPGNDPMAVLKQLRSAKRSDPKRYSERGYQLLERRNYEDALGCFKRAGDEVGKQRCRAHISQQKGKRLRSDGKFEEAIFYFQTAVDLFIQSAWPGKAAYCLEIDMGQLEAAGDIWSERQQHLRAASLYTSAMVYDKAASSYEAIGDLNSSARALAKGKYYNRLVHFLTNYRDALEEGIFLLYSKLCNSQMRHGGIDVELKGATIDLLGSDEEKEKVLKELKLMSPLIDLYERNGRHKDAFDMLINEGEFRRALLVVAQAGEIEIPEEEFLPIMHHVGAEAIWTSSKDPPFEGLENHSSSAIRQASQLWKNLWGSLTLADTSNIPDDAFYEEIYSCFVALKEPRIQRTASLREAMRLICAIRRAAELVCECDAEQTKLPQPLAVVLGIVSSKRGSDTKVLKYSPLFRSDNSIAWDDSTVIQRTITWIIDSLLSFVTTIGEDIKTIFMDEWPRPCVNFVTGWCRYSDTECSNKHMKLTSPMCARKLLDLQNICALFCRLSFMHKRLNSGNNLRPIVDGNRRYWLTKLLAETYYVSAFEQDCSVIDVETKKLRTYDKAFSVVFSEIESLLHYRLKTDRDWDDRSSFSSILGDWQHAFFLGKYHRLVDVTGWTTTGIPAKAGFVCCVATRKVAANLALGPRIADRFRRVLKDTLSQRSPYKAVAKNAYRALDKLTYAIRWHIDNAQDFRNSLGYAITTMDHLPIRQFENLHCILSLYELLIALLLLKICPQKGFVVLPVSWVLLNRVILAATGFENIRPYDRELYTESLLRIIRSFDNLTRRVNRAMPTEFRHTKPRKYLEERIAQFLVVCLLNLATIDPAPRGLGEIWRSASEVRPHHLFCPIRYRYIEGRFMLTTMSQNLWSLSVSSKYRGRTNATIELPESLHCAYERYNAKDRLILVSSHNLKEGVHVSNGIWGQFMKLGTPVITLQTVLDIEASPTTETAPASEACTEKTVEELRQGDYSASTEEEKAVLTIEKFWKKYFPLVLDRRQFFKTERGKALKFGTTIICHKFERKDAKFFAKAQVLFTDGIDAFISLRKTNQELKSTELTIGKLLEDIRLSSDVDSFEELQNISKRVNATKHEFEELYRVVSEHELVSMLKAPAENIPPEAVRRAFSKVLVETEELNKGLEGHNNRLSEILSHLGS